ncbi:VOC family protein [Sphingomonas sp. So64.6b]|uniref:VOC family protein n=1 Tax=Sphingomonas sp. So64.6b TaxID=2997354 RepID=UPI001603745E|nr:VOC family protein [Sphingomonas sp. So64.6b]QNA83676.1 VOC family protein [Sphingomonas sp. So64.6b]
MIDHIGLAVTDIARSRAFYEAALAPLGIRTIEVIDPSQTESGGTAVMMGIDEIFFVIADNEAIGEGTHVAFRAPSRDDVDAFHAAAMAAGGRDNGAPGIRERYHPDYYAAFVHDPDGINVEAVCHLAEG